MIPPPVGQWPRPRRFPIPGDRTNGNKPKWAFGALVLLVVVAITAISVWLTHSGSEQAPPAAAPAPPPVPTVDPASVASADDKDPVQIITDDPTCRDWGPVTDTLAATQRNGWDRRDPSVPADQWTDEQKSQYEAVAGAMRVAADQTVELAKLTPHRVMRELYEQSVAYWRAYAQSVGTYRPADDHLARAATSAADSVISICAAIDYGVAAGRSSLVLPGAPSVPTPPLADPKRPAAFISAPSPFCTSWTSMVAEYADETRAWRDHHDPRIPASHWSPEQRKLNDDVLPAMQQNADQAQLLGLLSGDLVAADFAALSAQYRRAYAQAMPTFGLPDIHLDATASRLQSVADQACRAVRN